MGGTNLDFVIKNGNMRDVHRGYDKVINNLEVYEKTNPYSGEWNTVDKDSIKDKLHMVFKSYDEAEEYCAANTEKWEGMAVRYLDHKVKKSTQAKLEKLNDKINELEKDLRTFHVKSFEEIKEAKSKTIGCKKCESKISRQYLRDSTCPLCRDSLYSPTVEKRVAAKEDKIKKAKAGYIKFKKGSLEDVTGIPRDSDKLKILVYGYGGC